MHQSAAPNPNTGFGELPQKLRRLASLAGLVAAVSILVGSPGLAQVRPQVRDHIVPAAVQVAVYVDVTVGGVTETVLWPMGSGTVVSPDGLILTNWHVVDLQTAVQEWENLALAQGQEISFLADERFTISASDGVDPPEPRYAATLTASDALLDLAVLKVVGDTDRRELPAPLNVPFVSLGDSDAVALGDPIDIFGYPAIAAGALTYTQGVVSAFHPEGQVRRAWIATDALTSGGSSGGTAVNREGALIGIPTQATETDCRRGDVNRDGRVDTRDLGCVPVGGSLAQLRPVNLAKDLIARAGSAGGVERGTDEDAGGSSGPSSSSRGNSLSGIMPQTLSLEHASCFRIETDADLSFEDLVARLGGTEAARTRLQAWGWRASANRTFACDGPPEGEAGWIDASLHLFGDAVSAQETVDYFAAARAEGTMLMLAPPPAIGDHAAVLTGPASNGKEFTVYASQGPLLVRVTGVSRDGIPFGNVLAVARGLLAPPFPAPPTSTPAPTPTRPVSEPVQTPPPTVNVPDPPASGVAAYLPGAVPLGHAACFQAVEVVTYDFASLLDWFPGNPDAAERL